ncbi:hypothetical protein M0802_002087 [Mischocyttarus mexicanus]|nr:hypothetical protein M0802_002087 [Mischocyttarus mexicanus]
MFKTKRYSENDKKHTMSKFRKAKNIILNKTEINLKTMTEEGNTDVLKLDVESKTKCASKEHKFLSHLKYLINRSLKPESPSWFDLSSEIESNDDTYMNTGFGNGKIENNSEFQKYNNSKRILYSISSSGVSAIDLESNKPIDITKLWKDTISENSAKLSVDNNFTVNNTEQTCKQLVFRTQEFNFDSEYNSE